MGGGESGVQPRSTRSFAQFAGEEGVLEYSGCSTIMLKIRNETVHLYELYSHKVLISTDNLFHLYFFFFYL